MVELLKPPQQRLPDFRVGTTEYDPATMGFQNAGDFLLRTSLSGNHNTGHKYGTDLDAGDKLALLEYLKTL